MKKNKSVKNEKTKKKYRETEIKQKTKNRKKDQKI